MTQPSDPNRDSDRAISAAADKDAQRQVRSGEVLDADSLYREHVGAVLRHLRGGFGFRRADGSRGHFRVRSTFDAEEICHEAFAAFFAQWDTTYDRSRPPLPYILRIAGFMALRRARKTAGEVFMDAPVDAVVQPVDTELQRLMTAFYDTLAPDDQAVFDACFVQEASQAKAGAELGRSRDQIYRALQRVKRSATAFFGERGWFDGEGKR